MTIPRVNFKFLKKIHRLFDERMNLFEREYHITPAGSARVFAEMYVKWRLNSPPCPLKSVYMDMNDMIKECLSTGRISLEISDALHKLRDAGNSHMHRPNEPAIPPGTLLKLLAVIANDLAKQAGLPPDDNITVPKNLEDAHTKQAIKIEELTKQRLSLEERNTKLNEAINKPPDGIWPLESTTKDRLRDSIRDGLSQILKKSGSINPRISKAMRARPLSEADLVAAKQEMEEQENSRVTDARHEIELLKQQQAELARRNENEKRELQEHYAKELRKQQEVEKELLWTCEAPEDWDPLTEFVLDRLMKGLLPFEPWRFPPSLLGEGAFSEAYLCWPTEGKSTYVVKVPKRNGPADTNKVWEMEIDAAKKLQDLLRTKSTLQDSIAGPIQVPPIEFPCFTRWQYLGHSTLSSIPGLSFTLAAHKVAEIAQVINRLNSCGFYYQDIKPDNVMYTNLHPKLIDPTSCQPNPPPPEWRDSGHSNPTTPAMGRQKCMTGQAHLLARLFITLLDPKATKFLQKTDTQGSFDASHGKRACDTSPIEKFKKHAQLVFNNAVHRSKDLENSDKEAQQQACESLLDRVLALLAEDPAERSKITPAIFRRDLTKVYDPHGVIEAIFHSA